MHFNYSYGEKFALKPGTIARFFFKLAEITKVIDIYTEHMF